MAEPTFADRDGWIWMDGALVPWRDAKVHVLTHTLHYGLGSSPTQWELLAVSDTPITDGVIHLWNTAPLADGLYTLKLEVRDRSGNRAAIGRVGIRAAQDAGSELTPP